MMWLFPLRMLSFSFKLEALEVSGPIFLVRQKRKQKQLLRDSKLTDAAGQRTFQIFHHFAESISELICCWLLWCQIPHVTCSYDVARKLFPLGHFFAAQKFVNCSRHCSVINKSNLQMTTVKCCWDASTCLWNLPRRSRRRLRLTC